MKSILPDQYEVEKQFNSRTDDFLSLHGVSKIMNSSNFRKQKGFSCFNLFKFIFLLVFTGKNLYRTLQFGADSGKPEKDAVYRFLNSFRYNWRKFLLILCSTIIKETIEPLTSSSRKNVLILDDSLYSRNRSKAVELLARVKDHVEHRYVRGFRMLTLGWSDGNTFLPVAFSLLSSQKERNRLCGIDPRIDKRTIGYKRRMESIKKSTEVMFDLLRQAQEYGIQARYLLFDSWFAFPSIICRVRQHRLHVICMLKSTKKILYTYKGEKFTLEAHYKELLKKPGKAKVLANAIVQIGEDSENNPVPARILFIRDRSRSKKWLALLSTDLELTDEEIIRTYGKRWNIEVFFKTTKSFLNLAKEFQGRSYDSMVAHTTIVFCRYIMLAMENRESKDPKTLGNLFYLCCDELQDISFAEAFQLILTILKNTVRKYLTITDCALQDLINGFISGLPAFLKGRLQLSHVYIGCCQLV
ncbi:MAG: transposase [Peptococcaceae bacterium BRH_c4a]|nr:MAG: transposase [Peptococcaceae bacterium BRH_c4a]